jgi:hypothetical protein
MKKHRKWIILLSLFVVLPGLLITYLLCMPSLKNVFEIYPQVYAIPELQRISLGKSVPLDGVKLSAYGYVLTLKGDEKAQDKSTDREYTTVYIIGENRILLLMNPDKDDIFDFSMRKEFNADGIFGPPIEELTGGRLDTEFECYRALYHASVKDISLVNNRINDELCKILQFRVVRIQKESVYEFYRDDIKGILDVDGSEERPIVIARIYTQSDLNKAYLINFLGFNLQEATSILNTLTFTPESTN